MLALEREESLVGRRQRPVRAGEDADPAARDEQRIAAPRRRFLRYGRHAQPWAMNW
jgi:hypothetical protein